MGVIVGIFKDKLDKAKLLHEEMTLLVNICKSSSMGSEIFSVFWESFWELSREFPFKVNWIDYDKSCEEDIMQRYNAITEFMESIYKITEG